MATPAADAAALRAALHRAASEVEVMTLAAGQGDLDLVVRCAESARDLLATVARTAARVRNTRHARVGNW